MVPVLCGLIGLSTIAIAEQGAGQDVAKIKSVIEAVGLFADLGQFEAMCGLYDETSVSDYTSLWGNAPRTGTPGDKATGWSGFIPGFDTTRHDISVFSVNVLDDRAQAFADVVATHWLDDAIWQITGKYTVGLRKVSSRWLITHWTFELTDEVGDRSLVDRAELLAAPMIDRPISCKD